MSGMQETSSISAHSNPSREVAMRRHLLNALAIVAIGLGSMQVLTTPATAFADTANAAVAECGDSSGECCCSVGNKCFCGPCDKLIEACF